ncbi:alpha/beta fold hydrolase [Calditrichota bacterium]
MKKCFLTILFSVFLLLGCTNKSVDVRHDVAVSSDSVRIAYNVYGTGSTSLIFIHGWSCDSRYWKNQTSEFSKDYQMITIDVAGHGHSSLNRINYTMISFAEDIKAVIDKEKINRAILIGHSMGGGIIAEASRMMPNKIISIIGIDTYQNVDEKFTQEALDGMIDPFDNNFVNAAKGFVTPMLPEKTDKKLTTWIMEDMSSAPKEIAVNAIRNYMGQYITGEASKVFEDINIPIVSINARLWPTNPEANRKHMKSYKLLYIEDTGHFPMLEKPEKFNMLLKEAINYIENEITNKDT